jgi:acetoin utilization deacetylase AcuC-like enzyme
MFVLFDPATRLHKAEEFLSGKLMPAWECPARIDSILSSLESTNHQVVTIQLAGSDESRSKDFCDLVAATHDASYLEHLRTAHSVWVAEGALEPHGSVLPECFPVKRLFNSRSLEGNLEQPPTDIFARSGFYAFDMSSGIAEETWASVMASANLAYEGVRRLMESGDGKRLKSITALTRPPGHHCTTSMSGGYCYVNNAVVAVEAIKKFAARKNPPYKPKIAILDIDFHHGNGTQDYFYSKRDVLYVSIHGQDEFPYYSGSEQEVGEGEGEGYNLNLPLPCGSSVEQYLEKVKLAVRRIEEHRPDYLVLSLGFDTYMLDPLGAFKLDTEDYAAIAERIRFSDLLGQIPTLILLEGGYVVERLGDNCVAFLDGWERRLD